MKRIIQLGVILLLSNSVAAQATKKSGLQYFQLRDSLYMVKIGFTNIGVFVGEKELLLVDASTKDLMDAAHDSLMAKFGNKPVRYILNTHSHADHTGGNLLFMKKGAVCIAHENAKQEMFQVYYVDENGNEVDSAKGKPTRDYQENELPSITFSDTMNLHFNNENIQLLHFSDAHTIGDVVIYFRKNNVIALGDNYFGNAYTFGRNVDGMIKVYERVLTFIDDKTIILPGHGVQSNKQHLNSYLEMLKDVKSKIDLAKKNGKTLDEVKADKSITQKYDEKYGKLYIDGERYRDLIYSGGNGAWTE